MSDYANIYFHNCYEISLSVDETFTFSLQLFVDSPLFTRPFAIITASNPDNNTLSDEENLARNKKLYKELNSNYKLLETKGCYAGHCEEGYLVFDISLAEAVVVGQRYDQFAIFYNSTKILMYIGCEEKRVIAEKAR